MRLKNRFKLRYLTYGFLLAMWWVIPLTLLFLFQLRTVDQKEKWDLNNEIKILESKNKDKNNEIIKLQNTIKTAIEKKAISIKDKIRYFNTKECKLEERLTEKELDEMAQAVVKYCDKYNWDMDWILAMIWVESAGRTCFWDEKRKTRKFYISHKDAIGPAQFLIPTAKGVCRIIGLKFPKSTIERKRFLSKPDHAVHLMCAFMQQLYYKKSLIEATTRYLGKDPERKYYLNVSEKYYNLKNLK